MSKKEDKELFDKVIDVCLLYSAKESEFFMNMINTKIKFLKKQLEWKYDMEPLRIFKKKHKRWEDEIDDLENQLSRAYIDLGEEAADHINIIGSLQQG